MANYLFDASAKVSMTDVYETTTKLPELLKSLGYAIKGYPLSPWFLIPLVGETYLTPELKIATKDTGDRGPYGPRLIVEEDLTESERIYGKGIKTGADALAKVLRVSGAANDCADGTDILQETFSTEGWEVVELRELREGERTTYIEPKTYRDGFEIWVHSGSACRQDPVYIVRKKQPRKKRVLVFDYAEVARLTEMVSPDTDPGISQGLFFVCLRGGSVAIWGTVEEREE